MRIEFRILWIDDAPEWVESKVENIREYLAGFGFDLEHEIKTSYKDINFARYDIIAVDCNLSDEEKGVDALNLIRNNDIYTEILFYSQDGETKLRGEMNSNFVEGVYYAGRDNFEDKLKKLIDISIRKTQEINNLRGLVMAETSELDDLAKQILLKAEWTEDHFADRHGEVCKYHDEEKEKLKKHLPFNTEKIGSFIHGLQAGFRFYSLKRFLAKEDWESIKAYQEVIEKRTFLAHGTEVPDSAEEVVLKKMSPDGTIKTLRLSASDFVELRKRIRDFRAKFRGLLGS